MKRLIISVKPGPTSKVYDLDVPGDQPISELVGYIAEALELPQAGSEGEDLIYWCANQTGDLLDESDTLLKAGVKNSDLILLGWGTSKPPGWQKVQNAPIDLVITPAPQVSTSGQVTGLKSEKPQDIQTGNRREVPSSDIPEGWTKIT